MSIDLAGYMELRDATIAVGSALREMLIDVFDAEVGGINPADILESEWGKVLIDEYVGAATNVADAFLFDPALPVVANAPKDAPTSGLVFASPAIARDIVGMLRAFRGQLRIDHAEGVAGGVNAFERSW